jgi:glycosyltransferase involved in cell wall biosynthesis
MKSRKVYWLDVNRFDAKPDKSTWLEMGHELNKFGFDVHIVTSFEKQPFESPDHKVSFISIPASPRHFLFKLSLLLKFIVYIIRMGDRTSIIIVPPAGLIAVPVIRLFNFKNIHLDVRTIPVRVKGLKRSIDKWILWDLTMRVFSRFATSYSFITERLRLASEHAAGRTFTDYCIWSSGVSREMFRITESLQREVSHDGKYNVFYHGTVTMERGVFEVLHAVELLIQEEKLDLSLTIVGSGPDYPELKKRVTESPAADRITLTGFVQYDRIPELLSHASCCICPLPPRPEWQVSSPLKLFEYMAMEKPIIATRIDAHLDVLENEDFVVWTESAVAADIAKSIMQAYVERHTLKEAAKHGPELIDRSYDWSILGNRFGKFLGTVYG